VVHRQRTWVTVKKVWQYSPGSEYVSGVHRAIPVGRMPSVHPGGTCTGTCPRQRHALPCATRLGLLPHALGPAQHSQHVC